MRKKFQLPNAGGITMVELPRIRMLGRIRTASENQTPLEVEQGVINAERESSATPTENPVLLDTVIQQVVTLQELYTGLKRQIDDLQRQLKFLHRKPTHSMNLVR